MHVLSEICCQLGGGGGGMRITAADAVGPDTPLLVCLPIYRRYSRMRRPHRRSWKRRQNSAPALGRIAAAAVVLSVVFKAAAINNKHRRRS